MPAIETSTALYLYGAEPSGTSATARPTQRREQVWDGPIRRVGNTLTQVVRVDVSAVKVSDATAAYDVSSGTNSTHPEHSLLDEQPKTAADRIISQLIRFQDFDADWDGNDAAKPSESSLKDARDFIRALAPESLIPRPTLHANGHAILFVRAADIYAELEFVGQRRIGFYARRGSEEWSDEFVFDGQNLAQGLPEIGFAT